MPRPTPAPAPRRRPVAGSRGRRSPSPVATAPEDTAGVDAAAGPPPTRPRPRPSPTGTPAKRTSAAAPAGGPGLVLPGLAVAAVLLLAATAVLGWFAWSANRTAAARDDALAASRSHAQEILSYDYRHIDADINRAKKDITGSFRKEYADTTRTVVKPTAVQYHAVVRATVKAASVVSASRSRVVVLLFVDQITTSTRVSGPKVDQSRVRMTLVKTGGRWLVSQVDAL